MIFAGLDVSYGDIVTIDSVDSRSLIQYTVSGEIRSLSCAGEIKSIAVQTKTRKVFVTEKWVNKIAFLDKNPNLLIDI